MAVTKYVTHSKKVLSLAEKHGWLAGARYTNLRDIKHIKNPEVCFIDIDWKNYSFEKHLNVVSNINPKLTIARDIESIKDLDRIIEEAYQLKRYAEEVALVPKDPKLSKIMEKQIPNDFIFAYSVPTKYGGTDIPIKNFTRAVHLLGGRPDKQRELADQMQVVSFDCNRFTLDAKFGDYFNGKTFKPHPIGGYERCVEESLKNINLIWKNYVAPKIN